MKIPSGLEVVKVLTKYYGWKIHGREGSHVTLKKKGEMNLLTVPFHKQLKQGTFLAVLRKAKIEKEEFLQKL